MNYYTNKKTIDNDEAEWECFWLDITDFCEEIGITPDYCQEEFILEGELFKVYPVGHETR